MELSPALVLAWMGAGVAGTIIVLWGTVILLRRIGRVANTRHLGQ